MQPIRAGKYAWRCLRDDLIPDRQEPRTCKTIRIELFRSSSERAGRLWLVLVVGPALGMLLKAAFQLRHGFRLLVAAHAI